MAAFVRLLVSDSIYPVRLHLTDSGFEGKEWNRPL
jgi:hypothetical protein